ncbi:DASH complex subunit ask1 [Metarhizium rileyi]|uniref:DASH complex subunit ASK1 n=1 Tax=Metarhizium rileyi (strain RCEF 4871) TaxID=1649241 RepID=A0A5C6GFC3_METRR|nr:DASH complex subunit ask1 [Metarhizium rileyi]
MARSSVAARNLSLMEELEKLEQSITLTLQEIDHNFSKAHRIVTTSIIPVVEQYGEHSRAVWEASKFWKQFFEASANVSLSGYEELANDDESTVLEESTVLKDDMSTDYTQTHDQEDMTATPGARNATLHGDESLLDDGELSGSTPRPPATEIIKAEVSSLSSPFDNLKREMKGDEDGTTVLHDDEDSTVLFAQRTAQLPDMSMTPRNLRGDAAEQQTSARQAKDPLLHRVLDKNYRVQATPHRPGLRLSPRKKDSPKNKGKGRERAAWQLDDSIMSSPEIAAPTLRSEVFMSPHKLMARQRAAAQGPRTPGVSVQTPSAARKSHDVFTSAEPEERVAGAGATKSSRGRPKYEIDWDSDDDGDDDLYAGMSPPKTIQFALPPSKLLQTPAREASRRIVDDILMDAGADVESSEYSPTMVKMNEDVLNDSF